MGSTLTFSYFFARLYGKQHRNEFYKTQVIEENARELNVANLKLRQSEELKDRFFANISHELRTPLTLILGPIRTWLGERMHEQKRQQLKLLERNATLMLRHVNDLLDLSKLDAGKMEAQRSAVDLAKLLRVVGSHFEALAAEKEIQFSIVGADSLVSFVDAAKMERVFLNLLSNAFKFTPTGGIITCHVTAEGDSFVVSVADSGPGVPSHLRNAIFQRFEQGESGNVREFGGTGLGLAIAKEFVELHRGKIWVEPSSSGGAVFKVSGTLALDASPGFTAHADSSVVEPSYLTTGDNDQDLVRLCQTQDWSLGPRTLIRRCPLPDAPRVLIVEDHRELNQFIADTLSSKYHVEQAYNGQEGLTIAGSEAIDLVICDIMMPVMSGDQLVEAMRSNVSLAQVPIMLLTAKADDNLRDHLLASGARDYLSKPFSPSELLARVNNLVVVKKSSDLLRRELSSRSNDLLELTVELATNRKSLKAALTAAEETARSKDQFLMNLSHELRTPLTAILGWADLLQTGQLLDEEFHSAIRTIERNAHVQLRLVNDLLDMSRIVQNKLNVEMENINLDELVDAAVQTSRAAAMAKGVKLDVESDPGCFVLGDNDRLQQVLWNLLSNAIKFTPEGGEVRLTVKKANDVLTISVADSGVGIASDFLPFVFDPLMQADSSTSKRHGGLGLGMAITKHIIEMHGGKICVSSEGIEKGAIFVITLPASSPSRVAPLGLVDLRPKLGALHGKRIVVVDDERDTVALIGTILRQHGATVEPAYNAVDALEKVKNFLPDVIISDIGMPGHDGIWFINKLRSYQSADRPFVPAIAVSAYIEESLRSRALAEGFHGYLCKPIIAADLVSAVRTASGDSNCNNFRR